MDSKNLDTKYGITWCPGCPNFSIRESLKKAISNVANEQGLSKGEFVIITDVGCNAKEYDYVDISGLNSLHGRTTPTCHGIKVGNPNLKVIGVIGDGGAYSEGISHFIHACRSNTDFTLLVHDNQVFALTTGQSTPTTEQGFKEKTRPRGNVEPPLNPIALALVSGASFIARANSLDTEHTAEIIKQAVDHKGFSFVEIVQPCITFHNVVKQVKERAYKIENHNPADFNSALGLAGQHIFEDKIPIGVIYRNQRPTFESRREILQKLIDEKKAFHNISKERSVINEFLD